MNKKITTILLAAITILGFLLRVYKVAEVPMYGDELTLAQDAYSILRTGKDQTGESFPLTFSMRGGSPPGYVYLSIPRVWIFGPTELGVRAASIASGVAIILLMYLLGRKLFSSDVGIFAAFLSAVSPWGINLSRGGFETNAALFFTLAGVVLFLYSKKRYWFWILGALSFSLAIFTYSTFKLLIPLLLPFLYWYLGGTKFFFSRKTIGYLIPTLVVFLFFAGLLLSQVFSNNSERRFLSANIFSQVSLKEALVQKINFERSIDTLGTRSVIFHNKFVEYFNVLKDNYLNHYSLSYLFLKGDGNPRHNMTQTGEFYFAELALLLAAIVYFAKKIGYSKELLLLLGWILISPLASALLGGPHALRSSFMLPPFLIINSVGGVYLIKSAINKKGRLSLYLILAVFLIQFVFLVEKLYFVSPNKFANFWSYPAKKASEIVIEKRANYDFLILSHSIDNIEYAYPVYAKVDPQEVIDQNIQKSDLAGFSMKKFGNVYTGDLSTEDLNKLRNRLKGKILYVGPYDLKDQPEGKYNTLYSLDKTPALIVFE